MISIDSNKCTKCNLCSKVCTKKVISPGPTIDPQKNLFCIKCGHCFAVCPSQAITVLEFKDAADTQPPRESILPEQLMSLIKYRRSIRFYKPEPVSREHLEKIIEAAAHAPSAKNMHRIRAYVYTDPQVIAQINARLPEHYKKLLKLFALPGFSAIWRLMGQPPAMLEAYRNDFKRITSDPGYQVLHHTPTLMVFTAPAKDAMSVADGWIAAQTATMFAETLGVGTCYNGYLVVAASKDKTLKSTMKVPANEHIIAAMTMGYPTMTFRRAASRKPMRTVYV
jgi:nitroreductase/NAD-dependent dihydropyrimidine dehydrogenase PreA subunit